MDDRWFRLGDHGRYPPSNMRYGIKTLLLLTFVIAVTCAVLYSPHPKQVTQMLDYIEDLPNTVKNSRYPTHPGKYQHNALDRRGEYLEFFSPMGDGYYLQTIIDEDKIPTGQQIKGIAVLKRVSKANWKYVFPIYVNNELRWETESEAPDPFEYQHLYINPKNPSFECHCPDCKEARAGG